MRPAAPGVRTEARQGDHLPGEPGVWVFIVGEATMFTALFASYLYSRSRDIGLFRTSQRALNVDFGVADTVLLLTSSLLVFLALRAVRAGAQRHAAVLVPLAICCGAGFGALKITEYAEKVHAHLLPTTNDFFMNYFMLTGIHFFHLVIGLGLLGHLWRLSLQPKLTPAQLRFFEGGACYWHLVDFLWIVIFPLLYLVR